MNYKVVQQGNTKTFPTNSSAVKGMGKEIKSSKIAHEPSDTSGKQ